VLVTWVGGHLAASGEITAGQLIAFYGYAGFLVIPLRVSAEAVEKFTRAFVGARKMLRVLAVERAVKDPVDPLPEPPAGVPLNDPASGLTIRPGGLTCLVSAAPDETSLLADRLGRIVAGSGVQLGEAELDRLPLAVVRRRILVSEPDPLIFSGTLRTELDPWARSSDSEITDAIEVAAAEDVLVALAAGLDEVVDERGRSFSGGQRQRLVLARALLSDAEILVLVEPTSAVDAHTEARIARQLHDYRAGKTTVVVSSSPLVLDQADTVVLIADGKVQAEGTHRELLRTHPAYRDVVTRGAAA
jgi:ABC-type multidrug transport system fused ATPase/permease subunit